MTCERAVVVTNYGNFLSGNTRDSIRAACARWGALYHEYIPADTGGFFPNYLRFPYLLENAGEWRQVALLDADTVVSDFAPSIFDACPDPGAVYGVGDGETPRYTDDQRMRCYTETRQRWLDAVCHELSWDLEDPDVYYPRRFLNTGVLVLSPDHQWAPLRRFRDAMSRLGRYRHSAHCEQALWNACLWMDGARVSFLPETWNYLSPPQGDHEMVAHVYHFTGLDAPRQKGRERSFNWRRTR
jgi:hypothetical protein